MKSIRVEIPLLMIALLAVFLANIKPSVVDQVIPSLTPYVPTPRPKPTHYPPPSTSTPTPVATKVFSIEQQLHQIDEELKQSLTASIAFNAPTSMKLDQSTTIELLLNPAIEPTTLAAQVTETGQIITTRVEITPRMKVVLKAQDQDAFDIQPLHDDPEQVISATETTKWSWFVTARKAGSHRLTIIVYRLVKFEEQDHWREVESYKADIDVEVTLAQRMETWDWKWLASFILTFVGSALGVLTWLNNQKKEQKTEKSKNVKKTRK